MAMGWKEALEFLADSENKTSKIRSGDFFENNLTVLLIRMLIFEIFLKSRYKDLPGLLLNLEKLFENRFSKVPEFSGRLKSSSQFMKNSFSQRNFTVLIKSSDYDGTFFIENSEFY